MKKASAKIRNKIKQKIARSIRQLEKIYGRSGSDRPNRSDRRTDRGGGGDIKN